MNKKHQRFLIVISIFAMLFGVLLVGNNVVYAEYAETKSQEYQGSNFCIKREGSVWAWSLDAAWMSFTKTGNWETDNWFYKLKPYSRVVVLSSDYNLGYHLVCYDFGSDFGWEPIVGWVQMDRILLESNITPIAP